MQAMGLMLALEPWLRRCWGAAGSREALRRHEGCFNTHPFMAPMVAGMVCGLEEEAAALEGEARDAKLKRSSALKTAAAQALAGIGDALFWGSLRPFCAALALLAAFAAAPALGAAGAVGALVFVYLAAYDIPALGWRWKSLDLGYEWKDGLAVRLKEIPWQSLIKRLRYAGAALALAAAAIAIAAGAGPIGRAPSALAAALYLLALRARAATAERLYAATCAAGMLAAAAGLV